MPNANGTGEEGRLAALDRYDVLDTPREEAFDRITRLARSLFRVPIATISFIDGHRLWYKAEAGLGVCEIPRAPAFCDQTIRQGAPLVVPDLEKDDRFRSSPHVRGEGGLRFYAGVPLTSPDGFHIGTLCILDRVPHRFGAEDTALLCDLARIVMDELELRRIATTDSLTGALSRGTFRREAERAVILALRSRTDLGCLVFDLDHFKRVNDQHGHPVGDAVLAGTVRACLGSLRSSDLVGRIGGEEFAVVLPQTGGKAALEVAEKLRTAIARQRFGTAGGTLGISASFGVVSLDRSASGIDDLLKRADEALYGAKAQGRDRCVVWQPGKEARPLRDRVLKAGQIAFDDGRAPIDCTVRSLSNTGAGLEVSSAVDVPERVRLQIDPNGSFLSCRILRRTERELEVGFADRSEQAA